MRCLRRIGEDRMTKRTGESLILNAVSGLAELKLRDLVWPFWMIESVVVGLFRGSRLLSMRRARKSFIISEGGPGDPPNCIYCAPGGMEHK